ncbi:hypothetical protein KEM56_007415, partial [Ascosphaera pollenicola]
MENIRSHPGYSLFTEEFWNYWTFVHNRGISEGVLSVIDERLFRAIAIYLEMRNNPGNLAAERRWEVCIANMGPYIFFAREDRSVVDRDMAYLRSYAWYLIEPHYRAFEAMGGR